jgi:hypothetical protein
MLIRRGRRLGRRDLGPFVFVTADRGYLVFSTDFDLSSHLTPFSLRGGVEPVQLHVSVGYAVPALVFDPLAGTLFVPDAGSLGSVGVNVFDAATGDRLTPTPIAIAGQPTDLLLLRGTAGRRGGNAGDDRRRARRHQSRRRVSRALPPWPRSGCWPRVSPLAGIASNDRAPGLLPSHRPAAASPSLHASRSVHLCVSTSRR